MPMLLLYEHIDLRVRDLAEARPFYEVLLPALGFTRKTEISDWVQYAAAAPDQQSFSKSPNRPARCQMRTASRSGRKVPRKSIGSLWLPPARARGTSKVRRREQMISVASDGF